MKRLIIFCLTLFLIFISLPASAQQKQKFSVANFEYNPFDMAAQSAKLDGSGNRYAIIKVSSTNPDDDLKEYTFNFGNLRSFVEEHDNELWVYVQKNAKTVTISRPGYTTIQRYDLKTTIESGKTYNLMLSTAVKVVSKQMLQFSVTPSKSQALVIIKGSNQNSKYEMFGKIDENGSIADNLEYGIYTYSVIASGYQVSEGRIVLNDKTKTFVEKVELYEGQSYEAKTEKVNNVKFSVNPEADGAVVLIKKKKAGSQEEILGVVDDNGVLAKAIDNDSYSYRVVANNYHVASGTLDLTAKTKEMTEEVEMKPNFSKVTLFVDSDADIYLNGDLKGQHSWEGVLKSGKYQVECKKDKHRTSVQVITVGDDDNRAFNLTPPVPITGGVSITSDPLNASVILDGKDYGFTPTTIGDLLIGTHELSLVHDGYMKKTNQFEIKENEVGQLNVQLLRGGKFTIESVPNESELYINDKKVGLTPYSEEMLSGDYTIKLMKPKYLDYVKTIHFDEKSPLYKIKMKKRLINKKSFYIDYNGQVGNATGVGISLGGYVNKLNMEVFGTYIFDKEDMYLYAVNDYSYWSGSIKCFMFGGKFGYGIQLNRRVRITPQVGVNYVLLEDFCDSYANCITVSARAEFMLLRGLGVSFTPQGSFSIKKGNVFSEVSNLSSKIKGWADGFNVRLGIFCCI